MAALALASCSLMPGSPVAADELEPRPQQVLVQHRDAEPRPTLGPRHAPVTIDVFINFSARYDLSVYQHLRTLSARHPTRLRVVFHILDDAGHKNLAEAAIGAHAQDRFFAFMDELVGHVTYQRLIPKDADAIEDLCERAGVDYQRIAVTDFTRVFEESELFLRRRRVDKRSSFLKLSINGVPSDLRSSEVTQANLEQAYDRAYAEAKTKLDAGASVEDIYQLSLLEVDASIQPIRIAAGAVNGLPPETMPGVIEHAPLIDPRAKVGGHRLGPDNARITIRLYCDFSTRYRACSDTYRQLELVREYFPGLVRVIFHHMFSESLDHDEIERLLAVHTAAVCADRQGAFEAFYQRVYRMPPLRTRRARVYDARTQFARMLEHLDVDHERLQACMDDPAVTERVLREVRAARDAGVTVSPTVVVGERVYPGSKTFEEVIRLIDIELMPGLLERLAPSPAGTPDWSRELPLSSRVIQHIGIKRVPSA